MAGMKVTLSSAMRARDVSRPRPEQLAEAARDDPADAEREVTAPGDEPPQPRIRRRRRRTR